MYKYSIFNQLLMFTSLDFDLSGCLDSLRRWLALLRKQSAVFNVSPLPCLHLAGKPANKSDKPFEVLRRSDYHCHCNIDQSVVGDLD